MYEIKQQTIYLCPEREAVQICFNCPRIASETKVQWGPIITSTNIFGQIDPSRGIINKYQKSHTLVILGDIYCICEYLDSAGLWNARARSVLS